MNNVIGFWACLILANVTKSEFGFWAWLTLAVVFLGFQAAEAIAEHRKQQALRRLLREASENVLKRMQELERREK